MNNSFNADGIQFAWDSTSLKLAEDCLYKYKLKMIEGWSHPTVSPHLIFGEVYGTALEHYHKFIASGADHNEAVHSVVREALVLTWEYLKDENGDPIPGTGGPWESTDNLKTRENLIRTIVWYLEQFGQDDTCKTLILADGSAAVEHSFKLPVDNGIVFCGHLDRVVDFGGKPYIQDQKTTKTTITPRFFNSYNPDTQISGMYPFAGRIIFNLPIKGIMLDGAQIAVGFSRFERGFIFVDEASLEEWYTDTMYTIERAQTAVKENYFPKNRSSCSKFAGCEFRSICSRSPHVREQFLKAEFERKEIWDPMKSR